MTESEVPTFDGKIENFLSWKEKFEAAMMIHGIMGPLQTQDDWINRATDTNRDIRTEINGKLFAWIFLKVTDVDRDFVSPHRPNGMLAWKELINKYEDTIYSLQGCVGSTSVSDRFIDEVQTCPELHKDKMTQD